jgi:hypothetical protein
MNRIHIDVNASGGRDVSLDTRRERVEAEARLLSLSVLRDRPFDLVVPGSGGGM